MSALDVERICRTSISTGDLLPPSELVQALNEGTVILSSVVKGLGEFLTSEEDAIRLKGLTFLSNILSTMESSKINRAATQTLTNFYTSKLDDFDTLAPTLDALAVLSRLTTFDDEAAVTVYKGIVETLNMKSYVQAIRHAVYVVVDSLLALHRQALKGMGQDFLNSYVKLVDGEKDPRNLMMLFAMDRVILLEFDVEPMIDDFFDITFCYFPISFRPPPNDPYGITAEDLKVALRKCISASPYFAKPALPLFLEKFTSSSGQSMKDLLLSIAACLPTYGQIAVSERGKELWEGIKTEVLYSSDSSVEQSGYKALESLVATIYPTTSDVPSGLAQDIIKQCIEFMEDPEKSQAIAATKALAALVRASPSAGPYTISQVLPHLFKSFNRPNLPSQRPAILGAITSLLAAAHSVYASPGSKRHLSDERSLSLFRENLMDVLKEGLRTTGLKIPAAKGSVFITEIPGLIGREEVEDLVRGLNDALINDADLELQSTVVESLKKISVSSTEVVESTTLPLLFHNLPDRAPDATAIEPREQYRRILASLTKLCFLPAFFETLFIRIITKLELLSTAPMTGKDVDDQMNDQVDIRECNVAYAWELLNCLMDVVNAKLAAKHTDVAKYFDKIIPRLHGLLVSAAVPRIGFNQPLFRDRRLLTLVGDLTETLMWELSLERQGKQFADMFAAFEKGEMAAICHEASQAKGLTASPLRRGASAPEQDLIGIYSATVQGSKADCAAPYTSAESFLSGKVHWAIHETRDDFQLGRALGLITAFVNKRQKELEGCLSEMLEMIWVKEVAETTHEFEVRRKGLMVYLHIVKALALLRHSLANTAVERVVDILKLWNFDPLFVSGAAASFGILTTGGGLSRMTMSHLTAKLLHAQRMWNFLLPKLIAGDQEAKGRDRLPYLVAIASLLPLVPPSIYLSDLSTILPLLLRCLHLRAPQQRLNAVTALISILETQNLSTQVDQMLHQKAQEMVENLLQNTVPDPSGSLESSGPVRSAALRCLALFPDVIRYDTLRTAKPGVVRDLGKVLDDPLRAVRREAVECRARWYRYGASS